MQGQATSVFAPESSSKLFDQSEDVAGRLSTASRYDERIQAPSVGKLSGVSRRQDCTPRTPN